jgi:hypothetical protein
MGLVRKRSGLGQALPSYGGYVFLPNGGVIGPTPTAVGHAPPPPMDMLSAPPDSGEVAQATVDQLLNQQLADQQAIAAANVHSTWLDELASGIEDTGNTLKTVTSIPWWVWAAGLGVFALVVVGGASRRYR